MNILLKWAIYTVTLDIFLAIDGVLVDKLGSKIIAGLFGIAWIVSIFVTPVFIIGYIASI